MYLRSIIILLLFSSLVFANGKQTPLNILHLSDIHLDVLELVPCGQPTGQHQLPWAGPIDFDLFLKEQQHRQAITNGSYGQFGCDTFPSLFDALITKLAEFASEIDAVVISGDSAAHHLNKTQTLLAIHSVADRLRSVFNSKNTSKSRSLSSNSLCSDTGVPLYYTFGNNDAAPDYYLTCNDKWYEEVRMAAWYDSIPSNQLDAWRRSGSFTVVDPFCTGFDQIQLIVLNTPLYAAARVPPFLDSDPCGQFEWLKSQLEDPSYLNFFMGHIPPGIDSFSGNLFYRDQYNTALFDIFATNQVQGYQSLGFFGHRHTDEFRTFFSTTSDASKPALAMAPAISPIFGNNPSFRIYRYDPDNNIFLDYSQYVFDLNQSNVLNEPIWYLEYEFQTAYGLANLSSQTYVQLFELLKSNATIADQWKSRLYTGSTSFPPPRISDLQYLCAQRARTPSELDKCATAV